MRDAEVTFKWTGHTNGGSVVVEGRNGLAPRNVGEKHTVVSNLAGKTVAGRVAS